jgi:hypothetical protein
MLSTFLELLGLASLVAGMFVLAGVGVALLAAGVALMFVGVSAEGLQPATAARTRLAVFRQRRSRKGSR